MSPLLAYKVTYFLLAILMKQHILLSAIEIMKKGLQKIRRKKIGGNSNGVHFFLYKIANN
jgi:hypothetical protein